MWRGLVYTATEISGSYELEKEIRKASGHKELVCTDPDCPNPILKYCHGEKKHAYFAHLDNCNCDYAEFDKENTQLMRSVKRTLYENFVARGFDVQLEVKLLPRHYTHLLFTLNGGRKIAVELGTQRSTANKIESLSKQYNHIQIENRWIVISNSNTPARENETFFIKRYLLNESKHKDVLIINWDGTEITQYIIDSNPYLYRGYPLYSNNYPDIYAETGSLIDLTFEDDILTLSGFYTRYNEWLEKKKNAFAKRVAQLEEEEKQRKERRKLYERRYELSKQSYKPTSPSENIRPEPKVGMKLIHKYYGEMVIIDVDKRADKTIIKVEEATGGTSSKTWEILLENNLIEIV